MRIYDKRLSPLDKGARRGGDYDNDSRPHASEEDVVIEMLKDFPDNIAAFVCHGNLTKADYETVLIPAIEDKLKRHKKLRSYTEIAPDFAGIEPGALWEDTRFGFSHLFDWERSALVTDVEWMKHAAKLYSLSRLAHTWRDPCVPDRRSR
jgi:hypothetical protein